MKDRREPLFVGRERELTELRAGIVDARAGRGRMFLLEGEPGIGKTHLAGAIGREAETAGATTVWGRCWEGEGAPAFWPWLQALRALIDSRDAAAARVAMGAGGGDLAELMPELRERFPDLPTSPALAAPEARFRLLESVVAFLRAAASTRPIVLILDDLHWADAASLVLLRLLARELQTLRLLVIGTYRDVGLDPANPLEPTLGKIARDSRRVPLRGLSPAEVERFLALAGGSAPASDLVAAVYARTDGNPFFVAEVVRLLQAEGRLSAPSLAADHAIPVGVHQTIRRRLEGLSAACRAVLATASVVGRTFVVAVLAYACGEPEMRVLALLAEAEAAGIATVTRQPSPRGRFAHALVRETLYEQQPAAERVRQHKAIGEAIEALSAGDLEARLPELAWHFAAALPAGDVEKAIAYAVRAGEHASARFAHEEAMAHYGTALAILPAVTSPEDERRRCTLLLARGEAATQAGDVPQARNAFVEVIERTRRLDDAERFARAALGLGGRGDAIHTIDEGLLALLEEAHERLGATASALHARVLGRLAIALYFTAAPERPAMLSRMAVEMAEASGDTATLAATLSGRRYALWTPDNLDERLAVSERIVEHSRAAGAMETAAIGYLWRIIDLLEVGDIAAVDRDIARYRELADELRQPYYRWHAEALRAMRLLLAGELAEAEARIAEVFALGERARTPNATMLYMVQLFTLRREQGRLAELEAPIRVLAEQYPTIPAFKSGLALIFSETGRLAEARTWFERLAAHDFVALPRDAHYPNALDELSQVCAALGDAPRAAQLYERLRPYADRNVVIGFADGCNGPVARYLGLLATTCSRYGEAERHFADALAMSRRLGAAPCAAHVTREHAAMLITRADPDDRHRAAALLDDAEAIYRALGMEAFVARTAALQASLAALPAPTTTLTEERRRFHRDGSYWSVAFDGRLVRVPDAKGLRYLAALIRSPGREFHVIDLAGAASVEETDATPTPDARARLAYRRRLEELRTELAEAERLRDLGRVATLRDELEVVGSELAGAYGLRGAAARTTGGAERVRKAVTKCIRGEIGKLSRLHDGLGRHLTNAVRTGTFCSYAPEKPLDWEL